LRGESNGCPSILGGHAYSDCCLHCPSLLSPLPYPILCLHIRSLGYQQLSSSRLSHRTCPHQRRHFGLNQTQCEGKVEQLDGVGQGVKNATRLNTRGRVVVQVYGMQTHVLCPTAILAVKRQTISRRDQMQLSPNASTLYTAIYNTLPTTLQPGATLRKTQIASQLHHHPSTPMQLYPTIKHATRSTVTSQQPTHNLHLHTKTDINIRNSISTSPQLHNPSLRKSLHTSAQS
jgi:hypothetical protein